MTVQSASAGIRAAAVRGVPAWAALSFSIAVAIAFSPNIIEVYGIHNDYEMLYFKSPGFFHPEASALFAIGRPVAGLLTNLPMFLVERLSDFRWTRILSLLTLCFLGVQMLSICLRHLQVRALDALAIALATFLALPFIYSVLCATAWALHLLTVALAFGAYTLLSRANVQLVSIRGSFERRDAGALVRQVIGYCKLRPVRWASIFFLIALFDYPPNALIIAAFPVVALGFSQVPWRNRIAIAARDIFFIGINIVLFAVIAKVFYLPMVRLFSPYGAVATLSDNSLTNRLSATYRFAFNLVPGEAVSRIADLLGVASDLWFLPQFDARIVVAVVVATALIVGLVLRLFRRNVPQLETSGRWVAGFVASAVVTVICFVVSSASVWASATGFITYRTILVPTAIVAIVLLYAIRSLGENVSVLAGKAPSPRSGDVAVVAVVLSAMLGNIYANYLTMRLARNELAYIESIVQRAIDQNSEAIVLIDKRPFMLPEDLKVVRDETGRPLPPYELGCFSGYCMQTTAIVHVAAQELGVGRDRFQVVSERGDFPTNGLNCSYVTNPELGLPVNASRSAIRTIRWYHSLRRPICENYSLAWHKLDPAPRE